MYGADLVEPLLDTRHVGRRPLGEPDVAGKEEVLPQQPQQKQGRLDDVRSAPAVGVVLVGRSSWPVRQIDLDLDRHEQGIAQERARFGDLAPPRAAASERRDDEQVQGVGVPQLRPRYDTA